MKKNKKHYTQNFYKSQMDESLASALEMVPEIIRIFSPKSVVDVGCGIGTWSSVFVKEGIKNVIGLDGDYVDQKQLLIKKENFKAINLKNEIQIDQKFDLAISLEVIEHLDDLEGKQLVKALTKLSNIVVFSAAIPGQGGTNHINEQWQSYWASEFLKYGFEAHDIVRPLFWNNKKVYVCYKQNIVVYVSKEFKSNNPEILFSDSDNDIKTLDKVHPDLWTALVAHSPISGKRITLHYINQLKVLVKRVLGR